MQRPVGDASYAKGHHRNLMYQERLEFIKKLARTAGRLTLEGFGKCDQLPKDGPDGYDIATVYDLRTEELVKSSILKAFNEPVLGEEEGLIGDRDTAQHKMWIVDPIDGTFNYQRGLPQYGVSIAYCQDGIPVCGAIYLPVLDHLYYATRGGGTFLDRRDAAAPIPLQVSQEREWARLVVGVAGQDIAGFAAACAEVGLPWRSLRFYLCAVACMAYVAAGHMDIFTDMKLNLWDCAAGDIIVREAGGPETFDYRGVPIFPEYINRRLCLGNTDKFSIVAAANSDLFRAPLQPILVAAGLLPSQASR